MRDLRLAVRGLRQAPVFTAVAITSLALAIGTGCAIFAVVDGVLLRPLQGIARPDRLASVYFAKVSDPRTFTPLSWPDFEDVRREARSFSGLLAYMRIGMAVEVANRAETVSGELVSENYLRVLGISPRLGRDFRGGEQNTVALIGEQFWQERFGADPGVVGRAIRVGGHVFTVIGVVPREFQGIVLDWGARPQLWIPMRFHAQAVPALASIDVLHAGAMRSLLVTGRLADGVSATQAAADIDTVARAIAVAHPERSRDPQGTWVARVLPLNQARFWPGARSQIVTVLSVLIAVAAGVLVVACANVASLLLTRAAQREREISVRVALGAGAGAVLRLLLAESLVIAAGGCAVGLLVAAAATRALASFPKLFAIPLAVDVSVDWRVAGFGVALAVLVAVLTGATPLRHWMRRDLAVSLRVTGAAARRGWLRWNPRHVLVAAQMGICLALLVHAGLLVGTFRHAADIDPFLRGGNLLIGQIDVPATSRAGDLRQTLARDLPGLAAEIPSVDASALASVLPMSGMRSAADIEVLEPATGGGSRLTNVDVNAVTPGFFALVGSTLRHGRSFASSDTAERLPVAIVNQRFADIYWGGDAVGRRIRSGANVVHVVGVVDDRSRRSYRLDVPPRVYFALPQRPAGSLFVVLRTRGDSMQALPPLQAAMARIAPDAALASPQTLASYTAVVLAQERLAAWCLGALATVALLLSLCGVYGTIASAVTQRRQEIGIRVALGAGSLDVVRALVRPAAMLSAAGLLAGSVLSVVGLRLSDTMLFGVGGEAPAIWALATALLVGTALMSAVVPALIASRLDAARVMRAG